MGENFEVPGIHTKADRTNNSIFKGERFTSLQNTALSNCDAVSITKLLSVDVTGREGAEIYEQQKVDG